MLLVSIIFYLVMGGIIFELLEGGNEANYRKLAMAFKINFLGKHNNSIIPQNEVTFTLRPFYSSGYFPIIVIVIVIVIVSVNNDGDGGGGSGDDIKVTCEQATMGG